MTPLNAEELIANSQAMFASRNATLFDALRLLDGQVPSPFLEFDVEDGQLRACWILKGKGFVTLSMTWSHKFDGWQLEMSTHLDPVLLGYAHTYDPTTEQIKAAIEVLVSMIPSKEDSADEVGNE